MNGERRGHSLQPTDLVHEATIRLIESNLLNQLKNRTNFYTAVAWAMRAVLVDHARARAAAKRPTGQQRDQVTLDHIIDLVEHKQRFDVLDLEETLQELESLNKRQHDIVMLRFFGGLGHKEIAEQLSVSVSTVDKDWKFARVWLRKALDGAAL